MADQQTAMLDALAATMAEAFSLSPKDFINNVRAQHFPKGASDFQVFMFLNVARKRGLDPFDGEIYAFVNKSGVLTVSATIDGWIHVAHRDERFEGYEWADVLDEHGKFAGIEMKMYRKGWKIPGRYVALLREWSVNVLNTEGWKVMPHHLVFNKAWQECARFTFEITDLVAPDDVERIRAADENGEGQNDGVIRQPGPAASPQIEHQPAKVANFIRGATTAPATIVVPVGPRPVGVSKLKLVEETPAPAVATDEVQGATQREEAERAQSQVAGSEPQTRQPEASGTVVAPKKIQPKKEGDADNQGREAQAEVRELDNAPAGGVASPPAAQPASTETILHPCNYANCGVTDGTTLATTKDGKLWMLCPEHQKLLEAAGQLKKPRGRPRREATPTKQMPTTCWKCGKPAIGIHSELVGDRPDYGTCAEHVNDEPVDVCVAPAPTPAEAQAAAKLEVIDSNERPLETFCRVNDVPRRRLDMALAKYGAGKIAELSAEDEAAILNVFKKSMEG